MIKGINQIVLLSFKVVAVSRALPPKAIAVPITELVSWTAIEDHAPKLSELIPSLIPTKGSMPIEKALKIKIIANATNKSLGFDLINGEIAAIAVAPQIAVPEAIKMPSFFSILNKLANNKPTKNIIRTKIEMYGKYLKVISSAFDADIVKPIKIIPACSRLVATDFSI